MDAEPPARAGGIFFCVSASDGIRGWAPKLQQASRQADLALRLHRFTLAFTNHAEARYSDAGLAALRV